MNRRIASLAAATALLVSGLLVMAFPAGSLGTEPSVRLIASDLQVTAMRFGRGRATVALGTYLGSVGGPFEIRATRAGENWEAAQVVPQRGADPRVVRRLPDWAVQDPTEGLHGFLAVTVTDRAGTQVLSRRLPFCPSGGYEQARLDDTGPLTSPYPQGCFSSPRARGVVWGMARGWAVQAPAYLPVKLPDGRYDVHVAVADRYVKLFDIDRAAASADLRMRVETAVDGGCETPDGPCKPCPEERCPLEPGAPVAAEEHRHASSAAAPPAVPDDAGGLPDLVALKAHSLKIHHDEMLNRDVIAFGATVWNRGPGALIVEGFRRPGGDVMDAYQYLYADGRRVGRHDAGTLEYDARDGHFHWHFTDFARYRLLDADQELVRRSRKEAFCLAPTDAIDLTLPNANWRPGSTGLDTACGGAESIWIREILDVGWGDTYHQSLPGQSFDVTRVPNGVYYIEVATNPVNNLRERTRANNLAYTKIRLGGTPGARTLTRLPG